MAGKNIVKQNMGPLPFFNDYKIYEGLRIICNQRKQRMQAIILEAVQKRYLENSKKELTINDPAVFHSELADRIKAGGVMGGIKSVAEYIEIACRDYVKAYFRNFTV